MTGKSITQRIKIWMLPIAMLMGIVFHEYTYLAAPIAPWLLALMLFQTYCRLDFREFRITKFSIILLFIQLLGGVIVYFVCLPFGEIVAQSAFICVFCPTATAAPVVTGMLGGRVGTVAVFSILSNFSVAVLAPFFFTWIGTTGQSSGISFFQTSGQISLKVIPLILGPLVAAVLLYRLSPKVHRQINERQSLSFYLWALTLLVVVGHAVSYVIAHLRDNPDEGHLMVIMAAISLLACCLQFFIGRKVGGYCFDRIAGAQSLGQKNTVLAIWMAQTFLNPLASVGPAAYVAWQNTVNSLQLWKRARKIDSRTFNARNQ